MALDDYKKFKSLLPIDFDERRLAKAIVRSGFRDWIALHFSEDRRITENALSTFFYQVDKLTGEKTDSLSDRQYLSRVANWARADRGVGSAVLALPSYFTIHQLHEGRALADKIDREIFDGKLFRDKIGESVPGAPDPCGMREAAGNAPDTVNLDNILERFFREIKIYIETNVNNIAIFSIGVAVGAVVSYFLYINLLERDVHPQNIVRINNPRYNDLDTQDIYCRIYEIGYPAYHREISSYWSNYNALNLDQDEIRREYYYEGESIFRRSFPREWRRGSMPRLILTAQTLRRVELNGFSRPDSITFEYTEVGESWARDYQSALREIPENIRAIILADRGLLFRFIHIVDAGGEILDSDLMSEVQNIVQQC